MINSVRNTVLAIISKDNRGFITPEEFNLFAKQAEFDLFEKYFYDYGKALARQNARSLHPVVGTETGDGYANVSEKLREVIERFIVSGTLHYNGTTLKFYMPGEDPLFPNEDVAYKLDRLIYNDSVEIEKVNRHNILNLNGSGLLVPSVLYPVYTLDEQGVKVYPNTIVSNVLVDYIRYPRDPKWTYVSLTGGEPLFDAGATDYQDFELPASDETNLVVKILEYAGVSIREELVVKYAKTDEIQNNQEKT